MVLWYIPGQNLQQIQIDIISDDQKIIEEVVNNCKEYYSMKLSVGRVMNSLLELYTGKMLRK